MESMEGRRKRLRNCSQPEPWQLTRRIGRTEMNRSRSPRRRRQRRHPTCTLMSSVYRMIVVVWALASGVLGTTARLRRRIPDNVDAVVEQIVLLPPNSAVESAERLTVYVYGTFPPAPHSFAPFPITPAASPIPQTPIARAPSTWSITEEESSPLPLLTHQPTSEPTARPTTVTTLTLPPAVDTTAPPTTLPQVVSTPTTSRPSPPDTSLTSTLAPNALPRVSEVAATIAPSQALTQMPTVTPTTLAPTTTPTTDAPTLLPTIQPSAAPTIVPTATPTTLSPTTAVPITTLSPTRTDSSILVPNTIPRVSSNPTTVPPTIDIADIPRERPTTKPRDDRKLVEMIVPIEFMVHVALGVNETIDDVRGVWQEHLQSTLSDTFGSEPGVTVVDVVLDTEVAAGNVRTTGEAVFEIDESIVDWKDLSNRAHQVLEEATTVEQLQKALVLDATEVGMGVGGIGENGESEKDALERPSTARIVLGFTILFFTLLSLAYWARLLWRKRRKTLRKRRLDELRKAQSTTAFAPTITPIPVVPPPLNDAQQREMVKGMQKESVDGEPASVGETETTNSDPFAAELQRAVSLDRVAWDEFQKQRETFEQGKGNREADTYGVDTSGVEVYPHLSMSTYSYPYGDEASRGEKERLEDPLALVNISALSPIAPAAISGFVPYGDESQAMLGDRSLNMSTMPQSTEPQFSDEETPTSRAMHDSVDVTTIESPLSAVVDENMPAEADDDQPESLTDSMSREVESVANFLRQYEQKRKSKPLFRQRWGQNVSGDADNLNDNGARATSLAPVFSRTGARTALQPVSTQRTSLPMKVRESSQTVEIEAPSPKHGRLGINQFSLGAPLSQMGSYKLKQSSGGVLIGEEAAPTIVSSAPSEDPLKFVRTGTIQGTTISVPPPNITEYVPSDPDFASLGELPSDSLHSQQSRLSSLRTSESMLDVVPSEDFSYKDIAGGGDGTNQMAASTEEIVLQPTGTDDSSLRPRKKVSPRSTNLMFNNIRSIFEEKVTGPIVPPSDTELNRNQEAMGVMENESSNAAMRISQTLGRIKGKVLLIEHHHAVM